MVFYYSSFQQVEVKNNWKILYLLELKPKVGDKM